MNDKIEEFTNPPIRYAFHQSPDKVRSIEQARIDGANCETIMHLAIFSLHDFRLPSRLLCYESFRDNRHFETVSSPRVMREGDVLWFCPEVAFADTFVPDYDLNNRLRNWRKGPAQHAGVFTGEKLGGDPLVLHTTPRTGTTVWRLGEFATNPRYAAISRIGRIAVQPYSHFSISGLGGAGRVSGWRG